MVYDTIGKITKVWNCGNLTQREKSGEWLAVCKDSYTPEHFGGGLTNGMARALHSVDPTASRAEGQRCRAKARQAVTAIRQYFTLGSGYR
jgi:hypothetical protein